MNEIEQDQPASESPEQLAEPNAADEIAAEPPPSATKQTSVARSAGIVSIAVMFSRVLGLVRELVSLILLA